MPAYTRCQVSIKTKATLWVAFCKHEVEYETNQAFKYITSFTALMTRAGFGR